MAPPSGPSTADGPSVALLRDRRLIGLLIAIGVVLLVALTTVGFSGAYFTSTSRSPGNEFVAGAVGLDAVRDWSDRRRQRHGAGRHPATATRS